MSEPSRSKTVARLQFQETPWDLHLLLAYTIVLSAVLVLAGVGNPLGFGLVLFAPGYVTIAAIFPGGRDIDWLERFALSLGLSVAIVPLLGLALNYAPFGVRFVPVVASIAIFTVLTGLAAYQRRLELPVDERLSMSISFQPAWWKGYSTLDKIIAAALIAAIVVVVGIIGGTVLTPRPGDNYTEFFVLGPSGNASDYPTTLNVSQIGSVLLGVTNHEATGATYTVRIDLIGVLIAFNATSGSNETVNANRTTWSTFNVALADGQNWTQPYSFRINYTGLWKIQFLLFKDDDFSSAYRELHLFVRVQ